MSYIGGVDLQLHQVIFRTGLLDVLLALLPHVKSKVIGILLERAHQPVTMAVVDLYHGRCGWDSC
jgi:hypothetical protein